MGEVDMVKEAGGDRQTETWTRGQTMKKTSNVEEDCGGEQVKSMAAGFM